MSAKDCQRLTSSSYLCHVLERGNQQVENPESTRCIYHFNISCAPVGAQAQAESHLLDVKHKTKSPERRE